MWYQIAHLSARQAGNVCCAGADKWTAVRVQLARPSHHAARDRTLLYRRPPPCEQNASHGAHLLLLPLWTASRAGAWGRACGAGPHVARRRGRARAAGAGGRRGGAPLHSRRLLHCLQPESHVLPAGLGQVHLHPRPRRPSASDLDWILDANEGGRRRQCSTKGCRENLGEDNPNV